MSQNKTVVIIGGGVSGLTASIYLARSGVKVKILNGYTLGSLADTPFVQNFPGFPNGISGYQLLTNIEEQAKKNGVEIIEQSAISIDHKNNLVLSDSDARYKYDGLIVATGSSPRKIQAKNSNKYESKGIHYCAICDGALYKDKNVIVVGGGNTALTQALYLSDICKSVTIMSRRNVFRADNSLVEKCNKKENIHYLYQSYITEFLGNAKVESIKYNSTNKDKQFQIDKQLVIDAVFVAIGSDLNSKLLEDQFGNSFEQKLSDNIMLTGDLATQYHQAIIAAGNGASVALDMVSLLNYR